MADVMPPSAPAAVDQAFGSAATEQMASAGFTAHNPRQISSVSASTALSPVAGADEHNVMKDDVNTDSPASSRPISIAEDLIDLFSENVVAKIYRTAAKTVGVPHTFPEYVPQVGDGAGLYTHREAEFWTCGFFPGCMYAILERLVRFPHSVNIGSGVGKEGALEKPSLDHVRTSLAALCPLWAEPIHAMSGRVDTHDVGFIVMPALRSDWELRGNRRSLESILHAARSLTTRFIPAAAAIRSWDARVQKNLEITCTEDDLLVIIDSMCNLDLLFYAASQLGGGEEAARLVEIATTHATTVMRTHLRLEKAPSTPAAGDDVVNGGGLSGGRYAGRWYSTHHVANLDPKTGEVKRHFTAQGYSDTSLWARGQAWAILGYAQTYAWTRDPKFLDAACGLAEYFLYRLDTHPGTPDARTTSSPFPSGASLSTSTAAEGTRHRGGRYVPPWDFDAPPDDGSDVDCPAFIPRDSSAGAIAANGMLLLSQRLTGLGDDHCALATRFRNAAVDIIRDTLLFAVAPERAELVATKGPGAGGSRYRHKRIEVVDADPAGSSFEAILKHGTANNNLNAIVRYSDHGLVYADYYLLEFGNRLLRMGLV